MDHLVFKLFSGLFRLIDTVVYWAVNVLYQLFIMISEAGIFTPENIRTFGSRIYVLLGVFMLFKVSFSFINYILNPDTFSDKSKGVNKLLMNFFVVLIGIVAVPYIFQAAYSLQAIVLRDNVIGSLVMGMNAEVMNNNNYDYIEQGGKLMSYTTLSAFIRLNPDVVGPECAANPVLALTEEIDNKQVPIYENGVRKAELNPACTNPSDDYPSAQAAMEVAVNKKNSSNVGELLVNAYSHNDTTYLLGTNAVNLTVDVDGEEMFIFDYSFILSTIAGGFLAWILLIFCIDIATRSVKLGFLQLIAPIPIISYIDPKNGKDGIFKKWTKECTSTYLSLFVRLLAIYFVLFIITLIINGGIVNIATGTPINNFLVKVFIIFGALMFAKDLPKLISDITGVKLDGGFTLNPLKKLGSSPYAAGAMGLVGGALGGFAANQWARGKEVAKAWKKAGEVPGATFTDKFKGGLSAINRGNILTGIAGAGSAGVRGAFAGFTGGGKGSLFDAAGKGIKASSQARNLRDKKYGMADKIRDKATDLAGIKAATGTTSLLKNEVNKLQEKLNNAKRNEHVYAEEFARQVSGTKLHAAKLYQTFNGEVETTDEKGNPTKYKSFSYEEYGFEDVKNYVSSKGITVDWSTISDADKNMYFDIAASDGVIVGRDVFNSISSLYDARNAADIEGRKLQKEINDINEDMNKFKDRNK